MYSAGLTVLTRMSSSRAPGHKSRIPLQQPPPGELGRAAAGSVVTREGGTSWSRSLTFGQIVSSAK